MRFVIFPSDCARKCAQPLSVGVWHLEAARFVMGSVSARLYGTDVLVLQKHFLLSCVPRERASLQKRCFEIHVFHCKSETVSNCV